MKNTRLVISDITHSLKRPEIKESQNISKDGINKNAVFTKQNEGEFLRDNEEESDNEFDDKEENMKLIIIYNGKKEIETKKEKIILKFKYFRRNPSMMNQVINSNIIYINDKYSENIFEGFINILNTNEITVNEENCYEYYEMSQKYGYLDLYKEMKRFMRERPDIKRIIDDLQCCQENHEYQQREDNENGEDNSEKEEVIAKNLDLCLQSGLLSNLRISTLNRIFNFPNRRLNNHHLLFDFIMKLINSCSNEKNEGNNKSESINKFRSYSVEEAQVLIGSLDYTKMTKKEIKELLENENFLKKIQPENADIRLKSMIEKEDRMKVELNEMKEEMREKTKELKETKEKMEKMYDDIKNEICQYIDVQIEKSSQSIKNMIDEHAEKLNTLKKRFDNTIFLKKNYSNDKYDGIFHELNRIYNRNVFENGTVEVTGNRNNCYWFSSLIGDDSYLYYRSNDEPNSFICFDFKDRRISISSYLIKSSVCNADHMKSWILEGWNDRVGWVELDTHSNDQVLFDGQENGKEVIFEIKEERKRQYKFKKIQLKMTGVDSCDRNYLEISKFELFGLYYWKEYDQ